MTCRLAALARSAVVKPQVLTPVRPCTIFFQRDLAQKVGKRPEMLQRSCRGAAVFLLRFATVQWPISKDWTRHTSFHTCRLASHPFANPCANSDSTLLTDFSNSSEPLRAETCLAWERRCWKLWDVEKREKLMQSLILALWTLTWILNLILLVFLPWIFECTCPKAPKVWGHCLVADFLRPLPRISSISSSSCLALCLVLRKLFWKMIIHWLPLPLYTDFWQIDTEFQGSVPGPFSWQLLQKRVVAMARPKTKLVATDKAWRVSVGCLLPHVSPTDFAVWHAVTRKGIDILRLLFEMELLQHRSYVLSLRSP